MTPFRHYINADDPSPFMGLIKKLSFNAGQMNSLTGGVTRLRGKTKDGEVELMRIGEVDHVRISPYPSGGSWEFAFVYPDNLADGGYLTLHLELKKQGVQYCCDIVISSDESRTFPIYVYPGYHTATTLYVQTTKVIFTSTLISFQVSIWDNHGTLGEEQTQSPSAVTGMTWVGNYSHSAVFLSADNYPLDGYIVPETYVNWELFLSEAWAEISGKYSVDVAMVSVVSDSETSVILTYMNNNQGSINYSPSGETTTSLAPLTSIEDDYDYYGNIRPYVNRFTGTATAEEVTSTTHIVGSYNDPGGPTIPVDDWYGPGLGNFVPYHPYLFQTEPTFPDHYWTKANGRLVYGYVNGEVTYDADFTMSPYEYYTTKTESVVTNDDSVVNWVSISNATEFVTTGADGGDTPDGSYASEGTITSTVSWNYSTPTLSFSPIQLPARNAKKSSTKYTTATAIAYSAGTDGSGGA